MIGIGCLAPIVLAALGAVIGHGFGGTTGAMWGLGVGLLVGAGLAGLSWVVMTRARRDD